MSVKTCKQHANEPIFIYAQCAACEIQRYRNRVDELKAENESLRSLALELRSSVECGNVDHCKAEQHELGKPCKVLGRIDAVLGLKVKP